MARAKIVGAIELGTSKVVVLVGEIIDESSLNIIGMGECSSQGVRKGVVIDFRAASDAVHAAVMAAEKSAGVNLESVYLSQAGAHIKGFFNQGTVNVTACNSCVSQEDILRAEREAKSKQLAEDRVYVHHIHNGFQLDGRCVQAPLYMEGQQLSASYWSVHGDIRRIRDHIHVVNGFGLTVEDIIFSSLAAANMVISEVEKRNGVLVVDLGSGTTDYVLFDSGFVKQTGSIAIGGDHLTNDISLGLRIDTFHAENLKRRQGAAIIRPESKGKDTWLIGDQSLGDRQLPLVSVDKILHARAEELFLVLKDRLGEPFAAERLSGGVVLTGGASRLAYLPELVSEVFGVDTRLGDCPAWVQSELRDPEYCTVLGLLHFALTDQDLPQSEVGKKRGFFNKLARIFNF